jgi:hypothetical protein
VHADGLGDGRIAFTSAGLAGVGGQENAGALSPTGGTLVGARRPLQFGALLCTQGHQACCWHPWTIRQRSSQQDEWSFRFCVTGIMPFGALFGGWLGSIIGIRWTLVVGAIGLLLSCTGASFSHLMRLKALPVPGELQAL